MSMKKLCKFPEIDQYRQVVQLIKSKTQYVGRDENNDAIFDESIILPTQKYRVQ